MADRELEFIIDGVNQDEYEAASSGFVVIPPKNGQPVKAGDSMFQDITTGKAEWKQAGVSLALPVTITSKGENEGKTIEIFPGVGKTSLSILKQLCKNLGVESKVITFNERKQLVIKPNGFEGGKGVGLFVAEWTKPQEEGKSASLVAKLSTTNVYPVGYGKTGSSGGSSGSKDLGI